MNLPSQSNTIKLSDIFEALKLQSTNAKTSFYSSPSSNAMLCAPISNVTYASTNTHQEYIAVVVKVGRSTKISIDGLNITCHAFGLYELIVACDTAKQDTFYDVQNLKLKTKPVETLEIECPFIENDLDKDSEEYFRMTVNDSVSKVEFFSTIKDKWQRIIPTHFTSKLSTDELHAILAEYTQNNKEVHLDNLQFIQSRFGDNQLIDCSDLINMRVHEVNRDFFQSSS